MTDHEPSSLIPLYDGMVISFINYEIRVNLEKKDLNDLDAEIQENKKKVDELAATAKLAGTFKASAAQHVVNEDNQIRQDAAQVDENGQTGDADAVESVHGAQ